MTCIECEFTVGEAHRDYAKVGFGTCSELPAPTGEFKSITFQRECATFAPAAPEEVVKRRAWLAKQQFPMKQK